MRRSRAGIRWLTTWLLLVATQTLAGCDEGPRVVQLPPRTAEQARSADHSRSAEQSRSAEPAGVVRPATSRPVEPLPVGALGPLETVEVLLAGERFVLEVADDPAEQQQGLMFRRSMPADHGMIFVFPAEQPRSFWMRNTHIPLDLIYVDGSRRIVGIHPLEPLDERSVLSGVPALYAIELNRGTAARLGLHIGMTLDLPASITDR